MFFGSPEFLFAFLPAMLLAISIAACTGEKVTTLVLIVGSLMFYSAWNVAHLPILLASIAVNYCVALEASNPDVRRASRATLLGILFNLALLSLFKFGPFVTPWVDQPHGVLSVGLSALPLGISFFTFQQIAFLLSVRQGEFGVPHLRDYALFVSFFPHLIAGPIVRYGDVGASLRVIHANLLQRSNIVPAFALIVIGLFKKLAVADGIASYVDASFKAAQFQEPMTWSAAWAGAIGFSLQVYFDFSGYCDIAIGLALLFGVRFPINFNSPLKASNIAELWRRWNITLSRFLHATVYMPLAGARRDHWRQYTALILTMVVCGVWHGVGFGFVVFGLVNGVALVVHRFWRKIPNRLLSDQSFLLQWGGRMITTLVFSLSLVFFRADSLPSALYFLKAMASPAGGGGDIVALMLTGLLLCCVWLLPSSAEIIDYRFESQVCWPIFSPKVMGMILGFALGTVLLILWMQPLRPTFIYFAY